MILTNPIIDRALEDSAKTVVATSISGGKDSFTVAAEVNDHLDSIGFTGTRILVHSDLGLIEQSQSKEICERLSEHLQVPLHTVKPLRPMLEQWEFRAESVARRFTNLETVRISTPWSSAKLRFCTSQEKTTPICSYLKRTFPGKMILNVIGLRCQESRGRAKKQVTQENKLLVGKKLGTNGITWNPILDYSLEDVFLAHQRHNFQLHEAYTKFGLSRVSCAFCVLAGELDLRASLSDERNHAAFRRIAQLEIKTTFGFKDGFWLADLAPHLLTRNELHGLVIAKSKAIERRLADKLIPQELLFNAETGFPAFQPTLAQAERLGYARAKIGEILNLPVKYTTATGVFNRYAELLEIKAEKEAIKSKQAAARAVRRAKAGIIEPVQELTQGKLF